MRFAVLLLAALASGSFAQNRQPIKITTSHTIAATGTKGWKKSAADPLAFAKKVDAAMKSLKATRQQIVVEFDGQKGKGQAFNEVKILDSKHYAIEFFNADVPEPYNGEIRADGMKFSILGAGSWSRPVSLAGVPRETPSPAEAVKGWPLSHPKMMYTGILFRSNVWEALASGLQRGLEGFALSVDERRATVQGVKVHNLRWVATRSAASAKKLGPSKIELVFDAARHLPVTIRVHMQPKGDAKPTRMLWQSIWRFNETFKPADFFVPAGR